MLPVTIDFETESIQGRPDYPPEPVGVAIMWPGQAPRYYAWGHPTGNNCSIWDAQREVEMAYANPGGVLFQNARFDLDVAEVHLGIKPPSWDMVHDTQLLLFLDDPHARTYSLKPAAEKYLGMPPTEQDAVADWLIANYRPNNKKLTKKQTGAYISKAPGELVGEYAIGDVVRTQKLFALLQPKIEKLGMTAPYNRERRLLPVLLDMERTGIRVAKSLLSVNVPYYQDVIEKCDKRLQRKLGKINIDSNEELAEALHVAGMLDRTKLPKTATGRDSVAKDALDAAVTNPTILATLRYRGALSTCVNTFLLPWLNTANHSNGRVFTQWHSIRGEDGGARTGRLSSSPNMQNIPKTFKKLIIPRGMPALPIVRDYMLPDEGHVWCKRDFSSQEYRVLAHYEEGALAQSYRENPKADYHSIVCRSIKEVSGIELTRDEGKTFNFATGYGAGAKKVAAITGLSVERAAELLVARRKALAGVEDLTQRLKYIFRLGQPIHTWGGRVYTVEPPEMGEHDDGTTYVKRTFEYKALNYLIQGSSADVTKEALLMYNDRKEHGRVLCTVHDEINISVPAEHVKSEMKILKDCMSDFPTIDVPMLSDGSTGISWGTLSPYED